MMDGFHFLRPLWLLALPVAGMLGFVLLRMTDPLQAWRDVIDPNLLDALLVRSDRGRRLHPAHLVCLGWLACIVALAGPAWRREPAPFAEDTAALVVVVEVTETMTAKDVQPSRLERAAQKIGELLALRPDADVALFAYAGSAHRVMPLTRDASVIGYFARALAPEIMPAKGDATADAIAQANAELGRLDRAGSIVLISDGVAPDQVAAVRESDSVPINVLAMGAPPPDLSSLERIARATGGSVVSVSPDERDVERLAGEAERRIGRTAGDEAGAAWKDEGYWLLPLLAGVVLLWGRRGWSVGIPGRAA